MPLSILFGLPRQPPFDAGALSTTRATAQHLLRGSTRSLRCPARRTMSSHRDARTGSRRFLDRSLRRLLHARGLSRSSDDSGRKLPTRLPACQSKVALSALAILLREAPHRCPTSHRIAAKKSTATAAGGCPITGRGTRKHTSTTELGAPPARPPPKCRRRARRSTSCRGCAAF